MLLALDPGSEQTAYALVHHDYTIETAEKIANADLLAAIPCWGNVEALVIEGMENHGHVVGAAVFQAARMLGRLEQLADHLARPCFVYPRSEYARALIGGFVYSDALIRKALLRRFGGDKKGEPLNLLKGGGSDKRSAFALAAYHLDRMRLARRRTVAR